MNFNSNHWDLNKILSRETKHYSLCCKEKKMDFLIQNLFVDYFFSNLEPWQANKLNKSGSASESIKNGILNELYLSNILCLTQVPVKLPKVYTSYHVHLLFAEVNLKLNRQFYNAVQNTFKDIFNRVKFRNRNCLSGFKIIVSDNFIQNSTKRLIFYL